MLLYRQIFFCWFNIFFSNTIFGFYSSRDFHSVNGLIGLELLQIDGLLVWHLEKQRMLSDFLIDATHACSVAMPCHYHYAAMTTSPLDRPKPLKRAHCHPSRPPHPPALTVAIRTSSALTAIQSPPRDADPPTYLKYVDTTHFLCTWNWNMLTPLNLTWIFNMLGNSRQFWF